MSFDDEMIIDNVKKALCDTEITFDTVESALLALQARTSSALETVDLEAAQTACLASLSSPLSSIALCAAAGVAQDLSRDAATSATLTPRALPLLLTLVAAPAPTVQGAALSAVLCLTVGDEAGLFPAAPAPLRSALAELVALGAVRDVLAGDVLAEVGGAGAGGAEEGAGDALGARLLGPCVEAEQLAAD